jgi:predicted nucleotidyltransferase
VPFGRRVFEELGPHNALRFNPGQVAIKIQEYTTWRLESVVALFLRYCTEATASEKPLSIGTFGSTHYGLALPTSDIDVVIITAPGRDGAQMLERVKADAAALAKQTGDGGSFSAVARTVPERTQTLRLKYRSLCIDLTSVPISRASNKAVASTDMLKFMLEQRGGGQTALVQSILVFKLLMHHLEASQWHERARGQKFKAISISFFALAVLDQLPELVAGSAIDTNLLVLIKSFATFPFRQLQVNIDKDGKTAILRKTLSADVVVFLGVQDSNSTLNVTHAHVYACQKNC